MNTDACFDCNEMNPYCATCHAAILINQLNTFTRDYAFKYPDCKTVVGCADCPYKLTDETILSLDVAKKVKCIELFDHLSITPENIKNERLLDDQKLKLLVHGLDDARTLFCKEEERIIFTEAFRRLQYKTQVMINSASDDQRTRLLHSLEVQKISRKISIALKANYELAETIAIGHDIGHAPFGHAGENAIHAFLEENFAGAFSHALQSVKVLDFLCSHRLLKPMGMKGLGVSDYVLEGVLKHDTDSFSGNIASAAYKLQYECPSLYKPVGMTLDEFKEDEIWIGSIESQIVCWADKIAYMSHDWEEFVDVDLLEVMLSRINSMVIELNEYMENPKNTKYDYLQDIEIDNLIKIDNRFYALKEAFYKERDNNWKESFLTAISDLIEVLDESINTQQGHPSSFLFFTKEQYSLFCSFFKVAKAWIIVTDFFPESVGGKMDIIFVIYQYLCNTTSHRTVPTLISALVNSSNKKMEELKINGSSLKREELIKNCNDSLRKYRDEILGSDRSSVLTVESMKEYKNGIKSSFAVGYDKEYADAIAIIGEFIYGEFIESTRVKFMTQKATRVINELLSYYYIHQTMLPLKYRNRIELESSLGSKTTRITSLLKEYYKDRILSAAKEDEKLYKAKGEYFNKFRKRLAIQVERIIGTTLLPKSGKEINEYSLDEAIALANDVDDTIEKDIRFARQAIALRVVADYVSGMTDRMAEKKYNEICSSSTQWSKAYSERATFDI